MKYAWMVVSGALGGLIALVLRDLTSSVVESWREWRINRALKENEKKFIEQQKHTWRV